MSESPLPLTRELDRTGRKATPFAPLVEEIHGCLWLDNPSGSERMDGKKWIGWASVGGADAFRFQGIEQLPLDVVWWTNLDQGEAWSLGRWRRFKDGGLLGPDWSSLMIDVALPQAISEPEKWVPRWSECFTRIAQRLSRWAAADNKEEPWNWGEGNAVEALASRWGQWKDPSLDAMTLLFEKAYSSSLKISWPDASLKGLRQLRLTRSRWNHARSVLNHRIPSGHWEVITDEWTEGYRRWNWVKDQTCPLLLELEFLGWRTNIEHAEAQGRLRLGHRGQAFNPIPVESIWVTGEEALELNIYGEWTILKGFKGQSWSSVEGLPSWWNTSLDLLGPLTPWSMTYGLLSNMVWKALASPIRSPESRKKGAFSAQAVWLTAADRALCAESARVLQKNGYVVLGYGDGGVDIAFDPQGNVNHLIDALREADLRLPRALASQFKFKPQDDDPQGPHLEWVLDTWMKKEGPESILWEIDRLVAPWPGKGVQSVLQSSAKQLDKLNIEALPRLKETWKKDLLTQARLSVDRLKATINKENNKEK